MHICAVCKEEKGDCCQWNVKPQTDNLANNLDMNTFVMSALAIDKLQNHCLTKVESIQVQPPLQIVTIPDTCEG